MASFKQSYGKDIQEAFNAFHQANEIWKEIPGFKGRYQISNMARVKSFHRNEDGQILGLRLAGKYLSVSIGVKRQVKSRNIYIHRLVAAAFVANPGNHLEVNHKDGDKLNNRAENLEWVSRKENVAHSFAMGLHLKDGKKADAKLNPIDVHRIREMYFSGMTKTKIAITCSLGKSTVGNIINGKTWKHLPL